MTMLPAREAYRRWAPSYAGETAVSFLEDRLVASSDTSPAGRALLDVGCGTGRRMRDAGAALAVGVDLTPEMLAHRQDDAQARGLCAGDVCALPFASETFDVVWCRLVIGHGPALGDAYAELARVCRVGGAVIVSDLCAEAVAAGHRRTFRDARGEVHEVEHFVHSADAQIDAAGRAGLALTTRCTGEVDARVRPFYASAGRLAAYEAQRGLPLVVALAYRREASP
jgi:malonyl-CoA O-methyltransferase